MSDENLERITILLQARDRDFARAMDRNNKLIARLNRDSSRNMTQMSQTVNSRLDQMATSAASFGRAFAMGLAGGAVTGAVTVLTSGLAQSVRGIASIGDAARRAGMELESFQEWAFVAQQNRIGIDQLVDGFKELSLRADEFITTGGGSAAEAFQRLGFGADTLARQLEDPSELMLEIIGRLEGMDRAAQIRIADEVFGGSAGERFVELLAQGEDGLRRTIARGHEVGAVLDEEVITRADEVARRFDQIAIALGNMGKNLVVSFADAVTSVLFLADELEASFRARRDRLVGEAAGSAIDATPGAAQELRADLDELAGAYNLLGIEARTTAGRLEVFAGMLEDIDDTAGADAFYEMADALVDAVDGFNQGTIEGAALRDVVEEIVGRADDAAEAVGGIDEQTMGRVGEAIQTLRGFLEGLTQEAETAAEAVARATGSYGMTEGSPLDALVMPPSPFAPRTSPQPRARPMDIGLPPPSRQGGGAGGGGGESFASAVADIQARTTALEMEAAALLAVAASGVQYGDAVEYARTRAQLMNQALREGRAITPELQAEIDRLAQAYVTAGQSAEDAAQSMERVRETTERGVDAMTDLFMGIAQGGDAARSAIARLLVELARVQATRAFSGLAASSKGAGDIFSFIGGLLGRASGGGVEAGQAYRVNENTANSEIFVPSRSGGVLNPAQAKDALRGQGGQVVVRLDLSGDVEARVMESAQNVAVQIVRENNRMIVPDIARSAVQDRRARG